MSGPEFMPLADQIERACVEMEKLLNEACQEIQRDDLPDNWIADLDLADEAAQDAMLELPRSEDDKLSVVLAMLRRIDEHDEAEGAT